VLDSVEVAGCRIQLYYWESEEPATPVVLLHGARAHTGWWHFVVPYLRHRPVIALDFSGCGESGHREHYQPELWADEVAAAIARFTDGRALIFGHSVGSLTAIATAARYPDLVEGLVLVDSFLSRPDPDFEVSDDTFRPPREHPTRERAIRAFRLLPPQPMSNPATLRYIAARSVTERDGRWGFKFDHASVQVWTFDVADKMLHTVRAPVAVVRGELSELGNRTDLGYLAGALGRPVPCFDVPGAYHHLLIDDPAATAEALAAAVESLGLE
jgi:pimeloyl-ACP methyl ester carboxylesterase